MPQPSSDAAPLPPAELAGVRRHIVIDPDAAKLATVEDVERIVGDLLGMLDARAEKPVEHIAEDAHREHHEWVQARIEKERASAAFWQSMAEKSLPALFVALVVGGLGWMASLVRNHITWN